MLNQSSLVTEVAPLPSTIILERADELHNLCCYFTAITLDVWRLGRSFHPYIITFYVEIHEWPAEEQRNPLNSRFFHGVWFRRITGAHATVSFAPLLTICWRRCSHTTTHVYTQPWVSSARCRPSRFNGHKTHDESQLRVFIFISVTDVATNDPVRMRKP